MVQKKKKRKLEKWRMQNAIETATKEELEKGLQQKQQEMAKNMLKEKINIDIISRLIGLTKEQIESLR